MESGSTLSKVYGPNPAEVEARFTQLFQNQETALNDLGIDAPELEKTPEETEIISLVNFHLGELQRRVAVPELIIPSENIHILPENYDFEQDDESVIDGYATPVRQTVTTKRSFSNIGTAKILFHELIHLQGYFSVVVNKYTERIQRRGLIVHGDNSEYFRLLDEAVTEELTREFLLRYQTHPLFKDEIQELKDRIGITQDNDQSNPASIEWNRNGLLFYRGKHEDLVRVGGFAYPIERQALEELINRLQYFNSDKYTTTKQVFNKFVDALFTGHIYELGKLIDTSFGRGTFRQIGEIEDPEELLAFVKTLQ